MASGSSTTILLLALVCLSAASLSHGLIVNGNDIKAVKAAGNLYCSLNLLNSLGCPPLGGVEVTVACGTHTTKCTTDDKGAYSALVLVDSTITSLTQCTVKVKAPVVSNLLCTVLSTLNGVLSAAVTLVDVVLDNTLGGYVCNCGNGPFALL